MKSFLLTLTVILFFTNCSVVQQPANKTVENVENKQIINESKTEPQKQNYWQQHVDYVMEIDMDTEKHQYKGKQKLTYTNHSPDTLYNVYYHLYWNAFQPGSAMDWRARTIPDPDRNMDKTIQALKPDEIGFIKVNTLTQDAKVLKYQVTGTILSAKLNKALLPGESTVLEMDFLTQVPKIIRRAGRDNKEGIDYSMAQWYPKLCEYDKRGWHTDPYIAREFYGVWGNFDVRIHIDKKYTVAGTGTLMNPEQVGKGYKTDKTLNIPNTKKLTWHFKARNVHDFSWAADPDYIHDIVQTADGLQLHFFYQDDEKIKENWKKLQPVAAATMEFYNEFVGKYPYKQYSVIQAGDGGMEYAQCTFVYGEKSFNSLRGTMQHEMGHAWFQFALATNESEFPWMDEGFTSFIQDIANTAVNGSRSENPFFDSYKSYFYLVQSGKEEPMSTHSDHYKTNWAYWINSYDKGKMVLSQLGYIMEFYKLNQTLRNYYKNWAMKHPQPDDFFRIAEKTSGMNLKWFQNEWINTTHHIDYKLDTLLVKQNQTTIKVKRVGAMPMPLDILVVYTDDTAEYYNIPLDLMRGSKTINPYPDYKYTVLPVWEWTKPYYEWQVPVTDNKKVKLVVIDPLQLMADINPDDNIYKNEKP